MPDDDLSITIRLPGGEDAKRLLKEIAAAQGEVAVKGEESGHKTAAAAGQASEAMGALHGQVRQLLGALGVSFGVAGAVALIREGIESWKREMEAVARLARETSDSMAAFAMMQPGQAGERLQKAVAVGKRYGMNPIETLSVFPGLQVQAGSFEGGLAVLENVGQLRQSYVPAGAAAQAVSVGMDLGLSSGQAARAPFAMGILAGRPPAEMAEAVGVNLQAYEGLGGGPMFGYQVMTTFARQIQGPGKLGQYTATIAQGLMAEEGDAGTLWKRLKVKPGEDPLAQLKALRAAGIVTQQQLRRVGFDARTARAFSVLLGSLGELEATGTKFAKMVGQENLIPSRRAAAEVDVPMLARARGIKEAEAGFEAAQLFGPYAETGQMRDLEQAVLARAYAEEGLTAAGGDKRLSWWERASANLLGSFRVGRMQARAEQRARGYMQEINIGTQYVVDGGEDAAGRARPPEME